MRLFFALIILFGVFYYITGFMKQLEDEEADLKAKFRRKNNMK